MKKSGKVTVNFDITPDDREYLKTLAAKARVSQSEFMRRLICDYGETLVRQLRGDSFTPESGLPDDNPSEPELRLYWLTDGEWLSRSAWFTDEEFAKEQVKAYDATTGNVWWIQSDKEPDLPRSYGFRHIHREPQVMGE